MPTVDVQRFAARYVATSVLARRFHLHSGSFARHLKESGTALLAIPIPDVGKYYAFFLHKDVAAQIQESKPPCSCAGRTGRNKVIAGEVSDAVKTEGERFR